MMPGAHSRLAFAALAACLLLAGCGSKADLEGVKRQLAGAIPVHSSQGEVLAYLDQQRIAHSPYRRDESKRNTIESAVFVKSTGNLVDPSYSVVFHFDEQDRLIGYDVQWLGYIPL
jgi:hypothetical protein